ncbi:flagellar export protein FliJ [uncultured Pseudoteredinibacter sp.]|uniref:flagellar export protein FliJ n=1 Tax=uncultured Pseudoteredinibacter sp. TaxID=1641701 RepID=UPI002620875A|nr:flagellar export protein FliJ [uncultured Pseudoteredinibacter sp.]
MAKLRSKRLAIVLSLNQKELDTIGQQLSQHQEKLAQEQDKLSQLESYRDEYLSSVRSLRQTDVQSMQRQRNFIQRMQLACDQQGAMVQKVNEHCEAIMELWHQQNQKISKLEDLIARYLKEEQALVDQQEQKLIDELSTQKASRRMSAG